MDRNEIKEVVKETLLELGFVTQNQDDIIEVQQDMIWLRRQRKATEDIAKWVRRAGITTVVSGLLYLLWEGVKLALQK